MFGLGGLLGPLLAGLALVTALTAFVAYERKAGADKVRAELQPKLTACQNYSKGLEGRITEQNAAVDKLAKDGAAKAKAASQAIAKATEGAKVWEDNAARLRAVLTARKPDGDKTCTGAWVEIKKGAK